MYGFCQIIEFYQDDCPLNNWELALAAQAEAELYGEPVEIEDEDGETVAIYKPEVD